MQCALALQKPLTEVSKGRHQVSHRNSHHDEPTALAAEEEGNEFGRFGVSVAKLNCVSPTWSCNRRLVTVSVMRLFLNAEVRVISETWSREP